MSRRRPFPVKRGWGWTVWQGFGKFAAMELWTAFLLGLAGSAHCAGMCGPLALALPRGTVAGWWGHAAGRLAYNLGRVVTYGALGWVFGWVGRSLALAGVQRWVSIGLGGALLAGVFLSGRAGLRWPNVMALPVVRRWFGRLWRSPGVGAFILLGGLNGLLPCGLVYAACAGAAVSGGGLAGVEYMMVFGLGTVPMMLGLALAGGAVQVPLRARLQKAIPVCLGLMGVLLIVRGLGLGIPYLSPDLSGPAPCCH